MDQVKAAVDGDGKLIAWDFVDLSFPRTEADGTPMLASLQLGIKPTLRIRPTAARAPAKSTGSITKGSSPA